MAERRSLVLLLATLVVVLGLVAADQCNDRCEKECFGDPFRPACLRVCLIRCRNPPPTDHSGCTLRCMHYCSKLKGSGSGKMEGCVDSCAKGCSGTTLLP